jgi:SAM-dependent methyltransferase
MNIWAIAWGVLAFVWAADTIVMRIRAGRLAVLRPCNDPSAAAHVFLVRPGIVLDEAVRRAASAHARANHLQVLDIVAGDLSSLRTGYLLHFYDPATYRTDRFAYGRTAGDVMLVDAALLDRMGHSGEAPPDAPAFSALAVELKKYASTSFDLAVAPTLRSEPISFGDFRRYAFAIPAEAWTRWIQVALVVLAAAGPFLSPLVGSIALAIFSLQGVIATLFVPISPRDRVFFAFARIPYELAALCGPRGVSSPDAQRVATQAARRADYARLLAKGIARFFEPRREDCPLCGKRNLAHFLSSPDHARKKPGRFVLERCADCGHIFQNPRLSLEGMAFYYRDYYDGLGEQDSEGHYLMLRETYRARVSMVGAVRKPMRWLDIGAADGHFCQVARDVWPEAQFDGLDLGDGIERAARYGWVDRGFRGLFPELAPTLAALDPSYDVLSMSHYLEHTRDPGAEIEAASRVLSPGGLLMIEVPDPDSRIGRYLGSYWAPWFQPQHQHFLSVQNLERLLRNNQLEPVVVHRGECHYPVDMTVAAMALIHQVAPPPDLPWRPPSSVLARPWRYVAAGLGTPLILTGVLLDRVLAPLLRRPGWANHYRVLARKVEQSPR